MHPQNPLLERFTLRAVHGYKDITIEFSGAATVIVAENGTGKTTVLSALNAFLTRRFHRLAALSFSSLECKFVGVSSPIVVHRETLGSISEDISETLRQVAEKASLTEDELLDFIQNEYSPSRSEQVRHTALFNQIYFSIPGGVENTTRILDDLHARHTSSLSDYAKDISAWLRTRLAGVDVIYLPTYRRIERPLLRVPKKREATPRSIYLASEKKDYSYEGIAFGLGDIEARLKELTAEIERTSNFGYRGLSARILNDMLKGKSAQPQNGPIDLPDIQTLSLFLGRLGEVENNLRHLFENIETLYASNEIYSEEFEFLRYFLTRLNTVILQTKTMEQKIERFVSVCNSYLTMSSDEKRLTFDPRTLKVVVENSWAGCTVPLDALSSGEKQIVSLMAKLYLYEGEKLLLIDEPELSLSIDWQRKVLPDVLNSSSVRQLLAITHSPFIFENELDPFASGLQVSKTVWGVK